MKKIIAWLLVLALTATVSIGATLAYLTDTDEDVNVMTLGKVKIDQLEYERIDDESANEEADVQEFHDNKPLYPAVTEDGFDYTPGDSYVDWEQIGKEDYPSEIWDPTKINNEIDKMVFVKNKGDYDAYVRSVFAFEANGYTLEQFKELFHLNINTTDWTWEWEKDVIAIPNEEGGTTTTNYIVATATYNKVLKPGELTEISLSQIALDSKADNEDIEGFGDTYQVLVYSQGIQADGFDDPATALNEGFGEISTVPDAVNIPWVNDSAIKGIDLRTALHYYEGNKSNQITAKVTNVIFGLNKDYAEIPDEYDGTLVDVEQDVDVYAYYVPNGSNYDVYFLADDTIYSPKDSSELFLKMTALKTVETDNFDVSRVENMYKMFRECKALTTMDVSDWDTSNVTNMSNMFRACSVLPTVDVSDWDMSKVTTISSMFCLCYKLNEVDVSKWDTSNVTEMVQVFMDCISLPSVEVGNWETGKVTRFKAIFGTTAQNSGKMLFTELDVAEWDVSSAYDLEAMFYGCGKLTSLDLSKWDVTNVTKVPHMFTDCHGLKEINVSTWNTPNLTCLDCMFNDCNSLEEVDVSSFSTGKVKEFSQMFESCDNLEKIIGLENFDTTSGQDFSEMFHGCGSLKELNLSTFDTRNANQDYITYYPWHNDMFNRFLSGCNSLEKITFGPYFSFDGDGSAEDAYKMTSMPAATNVAGWDGHWYNVDTGAAYLPGGVPEETAATYVAVKPAP